MKNKKGQTHMTETIAVIFIFFILVVFGIIFYSQYQKGALKEKQEELLGQRAIELTTRTLFLPELRCSEGESESEGFCIDLMKLGHAKPVFKEHLDEYYFNIFSFASVSVHQLYPLPREVIQVYHKEKTTIDEEGNRIPDWNDKKSTFFIVTLRDQKVDKPSFPKFTFGYVNVTVYS